AARYVSDGRHLWNAGLFVFPPEVMLRELSQHEPRITELLSPLPRREGLSASVALRSFYEQAPSISIDYAVMERSERALVARASFAWDDLGSWEALGSSGRDPSGNVARGQALLEDSAGVIAYADGGLIAGVGLRDLIIVRTADVTLVCPRNRAQEVRTLVERLKSRKDLGGYL
ncbi:MAG TPA: sugar phosphate nucleotidyltransferase, partial [Candidatus Polarisedimenticolia bacterium]|nr:sugar phosphate nucleotidyltransferase [Candidatus Polarisedimenticolia bacterium]